LEGQLTKSDGYQLEDRKFLLATSLKLEKIMNEKMSKIRIQIIELQKLENPQKE